MTKLRLLSGFAGRKPRLIMLALLVLILLAVALWYSRSYKNGNTAPAEQATWIAVQPQKLEQQLGLVGRIQAANQETVSAPFAGIINEVMVHEGEPVKAGQELIRLDPGQLEIQLRQAEAELLKAGRDVQQFRTWDASPEVSRARRTEQAARAQLQATQANLRDTRALFERGIVARMEVDALTQQLGMQQQELQTAQEERRVVEARGAGEERKIAEMELVNARVRYQSLAAQRDKQSVTSPLTGVVMRPAISDGGKAVIAHRGLQVSQGTPLLTIIGMEQLQVLTQVDESDLNLLREGMPVQITGDGFPGQMLAGHISDIGVQSNAAASSAMGAAYDVIVAIDTPPSATRPAIRLGMNARVAVIIYRNEQGIAVPAKALHTDADGKVWVNYRPAPDAPASRIYVEAGQAVPQGIEVKGLQPGFVLLAGG